MTIKVSYDVFATDYHIRAALKQLHQYPLLGFDTETKGLYPKDERKQAQQLLKDDSLPVSLKREALMVANNSGLSFPSITAVTHFVFGLTEDSSWIMISDNPRTELMIWNWVASYPGKLIIHNTLFDLKIMFNRIGMLPNDYEDSALLAKCFVNDANSWKSRIGLKDLMAEYYDPRWTVIDEYEPDDLFDEKFLRYTAIDGASLQKLYELSKTMG